MRTMIGIACLVLLLAVPLPAVADPVEDVSVTVSTTVFTATEGCVVVRLTPEPYAGLGPGCAR